MPTLQTLVLLMEQYNVAQQGAPHSSQSGCCEHLLAVCHLKQHGLAEPDRTKLNQAGQGQINQLLKFSDVQQQQVMVYHSIR